MTSFRLAGLDGPRIGLGTNRLTSAPGHVSFVREAVAAGVRHIDTAHLYTGGDSERALGEGVDGEVLVATKGGYGGAGQGRPEVLGARRSSRACARSASTRSASTTSTGSIWRRRSRRAWAP